MLPIAAAALTWACTGSGEVPVTTPTGDPEPVDLRRDFPPPPAGGLQFVTPDYVIAPHTEIEYCWFASYDGPTVGMHAQWTYQSPGGHHVTVNESNADPDAYPPGTVIDCTDPDAMPMTNLDPLLVGGGIDREDVAGPTGEFILPEGMAAELEEGTRIVLQSHYVNTTADPILVRDAINLEIVDAATVSTWAAPLIHTNTSFALPQGPSSLAVDCAFDMDLTILFLGGHMHEWGTAFSTVLHRATGDETLYDIPTWDPYFRDAPPITDYGTAGLQVHDGDSFTTNCAWNNDTDHVLTFPQEMCVTFTMAYPLKVPIVCEP